MRAVGEKSLEVLFRLGNGVWPRYADDAEALRARLLKQRRLERIRIA